MSLALSRSCFCVGRSAWQFASQDPGRSPWPGRATGVLLGDRIAKKVRIAWSKSSFVFQILKQNHLLITPFSAALSSAATSTGATTPPRTRRCGAEPAPHARLPKTRCLKQQQGRLRLERRRRRRVVLCWARGRERLCWEVRGEKEGREEKALFFFSFFFSCPFFDDADLCFRRSSAFIDQLAPFPPLPPSPPCLPPPLPFPPLPSPPPCLVSLRFFVFEIT